MNDNELLEQEPTEVSSEVSSTEEPDFAALESEFAESVADDGVELSPEGVELPSEFMTEEQFYHTFAFLLGSPNIALAMTKQQPLKSLEIQPEEESQARAATDYLYKLAIKTPWLQWMVKPQNETLQGVITVGTFAVPKAMAIMAEVNSRQASPQKPSSAAANDNLGPFADDRQAS